MCVCAVLADPKHLGFLPAKQTLVSSRKGKKYFFLGSYGLPTYKLLEVSYYGSGSVFICARMVCVCVTKGVSNRLHSKAGESVEDVKDHALDDRRDSTESKTDDFGINPGVAENQETHNPERTKVCSHVCLGVYTCACVCMSVCVQS